LHYYYIYYYNLYSILYLYIFLYKCVLKVLHFPLLTKKLHPWNSSNIPVSGNRWGYFFLIFDSLSHVFSFICEFLHNTLTNGTLLFFNTFSLRSMILTGFISSVKSSLTLIGTGGCTHEGSTFVFHNKDTRSTLWILSRCAGSSNR
jgi:hypothetical protein